MFMIRKVRSFFGNWLVRRKEKAARKKEIAGLQSRLAELYDKRTALLKKRLEKEVQLLRLSAGIKSTDRVGQDRLKQGYDRFEAGIKTKLNGIEHEIASCLSTLERLGVQSRKRK